MATPHASRIVGAAVMAVAIFVTASACTGDATTPPAARSSAALSADPAPLPTDPEVINFAGLRGVPIGTSLRNLTSAGVVSTANPGCGPAFATMPYASPVFDGDELVLVWAYPPLRTPEGVMAGTPLGEARSVYPGAEEMSRPPGSTQFPGLLVTGGGDRAYLLLHDGSEIQKLVVGIERYARLLFDAGFGAC